MLIQCPFTLLVVHGWQFKSCSDVASLLCQGEAFGAAESYPNSPSLLSEFYVATLVSVQLLMSLFCF